MTSGAAEITAAAIASFDGCTDPRLRQIMQSLVRHLHAFACDVQLTEAEWTAAIAALTATGQITDDKRQEFILWSDALGVSMLVDALAHPPSPTAPGPAIASDATGPASELNGTAEPEARRLEPTASTVLGPFWTPDAPLRAYGDSIADGSDAGTPAFVHGHVRSSTGAPIAGAVVDVWQNGANGLYAVQDVDAPETHLRGRFVSGEDGSYAFVGVRPVPYTIPDDGPVGAMLEATGRHPWRPAHIHMIVTAQGYQRLQTHIFDSSSAYLESDAVFAVKRSLIRDFAERPADDPHRPASVSHLPWCDVQNDIVLVPL
jgi:catechol 1,2-dioxygenase